MTEQNNYWLALMIIEMAKKPLNRRSVISEGVTDEQVQAYARKLERQIAEAEKETP